MIEKQFVFQFEIFIDIHTREIFFMETKKSEILGLSAIEKNSL